MSWCETYLCTKSQHCFLWSCNPLSYDLQSILIVYLRELDPFFHTLFLIMFALKRRIHFYQRSRHHQGYLFPDTICKQEVVGALCRKA